MTSKDSLLYVLWLGVVMTLIHPGCKLNRQGVALGDPDNSAPDAMIDDSATSGTVSIPSNFDFGTVVPAGDLLIDCDTTFDTETPAGGWCNAVPPPMVMQAPEYVIVATNSFTLTEDETLTITGDRPIIFAVFGNAQIDGMLDVSAAGSKAGPGGGIFNATCMPGIGGTGGMMKGSGGGGGGGFGGAGAGGGKGGRVSVNNHNGGVVGGRDGNEFLIPLRGGCSGADGGISSFDQESFPGGTGGGGGGAVQIFARGDVIVNGRVAAAGGGGTGGTRVDGGGGGGSGGGILIEGYSVTLTATARVTANGGGGGEGGDNTDNIEQEPGKDGSKTDEEVANGGMNDSNFGGDGGSGGTKTGVPMVGANGRDGVGLELDGGGGGGGGGVGRIRINSVETAIIEPGCILSPMLSYGMAQVK